MNAPALLPHQAECEHLKLVRSENAPRLMATALMLVAFLNRSVPDGTLSEQPVNNGDETCAAQL